MELLICMVYYYIIRKPVLWILWERAFFLLSLAGPPRGCIVGPLRPELLEELHGSAVECKMMY